MQGTVGNLSKLALAKDTKLAAEYKALGKGYAAQRAFRAKWAADEAEELRVQRTKTQTLSEEDLETEPQWSRALLM